MIYYTKYAIKLLNNIFTNLPTIETERLRLRKLKYSDQKDIFVYAHNPKVAEHVLWEAHSNEFDTIQFLNLVYEAYNHNRAAPWGIEIKNGQNIIGTVGFVNYYPDKREAEIGYALSEKYWGKGLTTEAVGEVIKYGFEQMELNLITARCKLQNIPSYRVLEKCNFNFDGIIKNQLEIKGKLEDMRMYSLSKKEYENSFNS